MFYIHSIRPVSQSDRKGGAPRRCSRYAFHREFYKCVMQNIHLFLYINGLIRHLSIVVSHYLFVVLIMQNTHMCSIIYLLLVFAICNFVLPNCECQIRNVEISVVQSLDVLLTVSDNKKTLPTHFHVFFIQYHEFLIPCHLN